jgi:hypothetical protein
MAAGPGGAGRGGNYERMTDEGKTGDPFAALSFVSLFFFFCAVHTAQQTQACAASHCSTAAAARMTSTCWP